MTPPVTLADLKAHINTASSADDVELMVHLEAATDLVEARVGPMVVATFTDRVFTNRSGSLVLPRNLVVSVTSATGQLTGTTYASAGLYVRGSVVRAAGDLPLVADDYAVVYEAGRQSVPAALKLATLIVAGHLWETQRGRSARPDLLGSESEGFVGADAAGLVARGFALPRRAMELMAAYAQVRVA